jgi:hypothetical protein
MIEKDQVYAMSNDQRMWSKKMDAQKGKAVRLSKNLGSTRHYLGDEGDQGPMVKEEKIKYINEDEERERKAAKERATVKYNHQDFLNQFSNLTEQCAYLVETLSKGTAECVICHNNIFHRSAVWSCGQCRQPFHLGCIKRWIKRLNN